MRLSVHGPPPAPFPTYTMTTHCNSGRDFAAEAEHSEVDGSGVSLSGSHCKNFESR